MVTLQRKANLVRFSSLHLNGNNLGFHPQTQKLEPLCTVVIFRVKVSCIKSVDGIILWLLVWLVNYVAMFLVVCQLSLDVMK